MSDLLPNAPREYRFSGDELSIEANRELQMRIEVYGRRVDEGRMTRRDADRKIAMQKALIEIVQKHALGKSFTVPA